MSAICICLNVLDWILHGSELEPVRSSLIETHLWLICIYASHVGTFVSYGYVLALRTTLVFGLQSLLNPFLFYCFRLYITCPQLRMTCHLGASRWLSRASFTSSSTVTAVLLQKSWPSLLDGTLTTLSCSMMFKNLTGFFVKNWKIRWRYIQVYYQSIPFISRVPI